MDNRYKPLNGEERGMILAQDRPGARFGATSFLLGRSASTFGRELRRGRPKEQHTSCSRIEMPTEPDITRTVR